MAHELMNFLRKENKLLKEEVKELRELLQLNREALQVTAKSNQQEAHYTVLFKLLFEENSKLHRKIKELNIELETGMCKVTHPLTLRRSSVNRSHSLQPNTRNT